jgi:membrane protease YdiL (CAAX protease family)
MSENSSSLNAAAQPLSKRIGFALVAILWIVGIYFVASFLSVLVLNLLIKIGVPVLGLSQNVLAFVINALTWAIMLLLLIIPLKKWNIVPKLKQEFGVGRLLSWGDIGVALLAFIPYLILASVFAGVATMLLPGYDAAQSQDVGFSELSNRFELLLAFVALVIAAPIIEEVIFRGFLFARLKKHLGLIISVIGTSFVFAVLHMQLNVGVDVFALSIVLCLLRIVTGSIWAGVILHMTKNALAFFILFVYPMIQ